ncbi:ESX secretion-associated protein EspG OS=Tsukamurella paurometabola (strain ATCC 8368 / DSM/ CCUG 35730 / CIP 100753 / JCM 10117 / KCTC 9821 / NBRC 16120/ NCIMB 702349 / NCTC 13040) OX=521096 GN=Tpau_0330 PE=3 SV=1 [Tsukamurella paurometabola]
MDTDQGRVLSTTTRGRGGDNDVILSPGTRRRFAEGLNELVARGGCVGWFDIAN